MLNFLRNLSQPVAILVAMLLLVGLFVLPDSIRADDWKKVTVVYTGDVNGKIEPCG